MSKCRFKEMLSADGKTLVLIDVQSIETGKYIGMIKYHRNHLIFQDAKSMYSLEELVSIVNKMKKVKRTHGS